MACVWQHWQSGELRMHLSHPWWRGQHCWTGSALLPGTLSDAAFAISERRNGVTFVDLCLWNVKEDSMVVYTHKPRLSVPCAPPLSGQSLQAPGPPKIPACLPQLWMWPSIGSLPTSISHQCFLILACPFLQCLWAILTNCSISYSAYLHFFLFFSPTSISYYLPPHYSTHISDPSD